MSITYEEALATLTSMFGPPWTQATLDAVLRHHKGHMENTVESVLSHGDGNPEVLIQRLKSGTSSQQDQTRLDEQLARQLSTRSPSSSNSNSNNNNNNNQNNNNNKKKSRGTVTQLPPDFLRIPGYKPPRGASSLSSGGCQQSLQDDEALARMLQNEMFAREVAKNPEFSHLARGGQRTSGAGGGRTISGGAARSNNNVAAGQGGANILKNLSDMGETAKKRLNLFAAQFNANRNKVVAGMGVTPSSETTSAAAERRGLLDHEESDEIEFGDEMEMGTVNKKDM